MAASKIKKASALNPFPQAGSSAISAPKETGQEYHERVAKGRKEISFWLDNESVAKIETIRKRRELKWPKEVIQLALNQLFSQEGL